MFCILLLTFLNQLLGHQLRVPELGRDFGILLALSSAFLEIFRIIAHDVIDLFPRELVTQARF